MSNFYIFNVFKDGQKESVVLSGSSWEDAEAELRVRIILYYGGATFERAEQC